MTALDVLGAVLRADASQWPTPGDDQAAADLLRTANEHGVGPLVAWQLRRHGAFAMWPDAIRTPLADIARKEVVFEAGRLGELQRVVAALDEAGVPCLLLKGAALAYSRYPAPWLRPRSDNDLLVRIDDADASGRVLTRLGYTGANLLAGELLNQQVTYVKTDSHGFRHAVDLHWKISNRPTVAGALSFDELKSEAIAVPALGAAARAPGDVHALLLACLHRVAHHGDSDNLLWLYDIHVLASRLGPAEFDRFAKLARGKRVAAICASGLRRAVRHVHTAVPDKIIVQLAAVTGEASATFLEADSWRVDVRLSDLRILDWGARIQLLREVAFPDGAFILRKYDKTNRAWVPGLYVHRLVRASWRLLRRSLRRPGPDATSPPS